MNPSSPATQYLYPKTQPFLTTGRVAQNRGNHGGIAPTDRHNIPGRGGAPVPALSRRNGTIDQCRGGAPVPALSRRNGTIHQWVNPEPGSTDIHNRAGWHRTGATTGGLPLPIATTYPVGAVPPCPPCPGTMGPFINGLILNLVQPTFKTGRGGIKPGQPRGDCPYRLHHWWGAQNRGNHGGIAPTDRHNIPGGAPVPALSRHNETISSAFPAPSTTSAIPNSISIASPLPPILEKLPPIMPHLPLAL